MTGAGPAGLRSRIRPLLTSTPVRVTLAAGLTCCLGAAAVTRFGPPPYDGSRPSAVEQAADGQAAADRAAAAEDQAASRSYDRTAGPSSSPTASPTPSRPKPVAGLSQAQMDNAHVIVQVGVELKVPRDGLIVAVATAMQESNLRNLASDVLPESKEYANQGSGSDHDSVGLFQQRPSSGWGSVRELMTPTYAARKFYEALRRIDGWQRLSLTAAAQAVQISAYPGAYAKHESRATTIVDALT